ncbi:MAG: FUSC family protein [Solirubrobacteraceae bacterium]
MRPLAFRSRFERTRGGPRRGADRVRSRRLAILQTAVAAGVAWELAGLVQPKPYFAPIAAVITLGVATGQHLRRALELAFGVAVGILVADVLVSVVGPGGLTIAAVVVLAMAAALLFGAGQILVNQAAVSGVLLATLGTPSGGSSFTRFFSALIGGAVAVVIGPVLFSRDPLRQVGREAERVLEALAETLDAVADALRDGDAERGHEALELGRSAAVDAFEDAVLAARESLRLTPPRRRDLPRLAVYEDAVRQVDYAVRNTRVLARAAETAAVRGVPGDADLVAAVGLLARAVRALGEHLREPAEDSEARRLARQAALEATAVLDRRHDLGASVIVGQIRATAGDLLRGAGLDTQEMRVALGPYPGAPDPAIPDA